MNKRLLSLDVFRGITIAAMILVNTIIVPPYAILDHSEWNGCTLADLVFPFFVFIIGVSLVFSISKQLKNGVPKSTLCFIIFKRTLIIFALGLVLNAFPNHLNSDTIASIRVYGVLQRLALCYAFASFIFLALRTELQVLLTMVLLIGYWYLMTFVSTPDYGPGNLSPEGNVAAYLDRLLFSARNLYGKVYDPEGLLSTLPSIATALLGNLTGIFLLTKHSQDKKLLGMILFGSLCLLLGLVWAEWFPINKALWTSSYVLWTAGLALYSFAACYWLIEIKHYYRWSKPFEIFGLNAIVVYFLHVLFFKIQLMVHVTCSSGHSCNLRNAMIDYCFSWASLPYASLMYAISSVFFWLLVLTLMYRKKIFIRI